jgi:hypothetical protein
MPVLLIRSPHKGSGKSTLGHLALKLQGNGHARSPLVWEDDKELKKQLPARLGGCELFFIDNVVTKTPFESSTICTATQSNGVDARILGGSVLVTIDRPSFLVTMQNGQLGSDIVDRVMHVLITERPPEDKTLSEWVPANYAQVRSELASYIMCTKPLPVGDPDSKLWRFPAFYRHVAPVLTRMGYDPKHLLDKSAYEAMAEYQEFFRYAAARQRLLQRVFLPLEELVRDIDARLYPNYLSTIGSEGEPRVQIATLKNLLRRAPSKITEAGVVYEREKRVISGKEEHSVTIRETTND